MSTLDTEAPIFSGGGLTGLEAAEHEEPTFEHGVLVSPFTSGFASDDESAQVVEAYEALVAELEDEGFHEAVESLVDEVAGRHLTALTRGGDQERAAEQDAREWLESFGDSVDRGLAELEQRFADRRLDSLGEDEAAGVLTEYARDPDSASEQFLGGLVKKAFSAASAVAKGAVRGLSRLIPMGPVFAALRKLVRPLLRRVLSKALNRLPAPLRGPAAQLAQRLGISEAEAEPSLAEGFDAQLAEVLLAPSDAGQAQVLDEAMDYEGPWESEDPIADLDRARTTLARQLSEAEPGRPPTEQLEQFIPVVMAAMPLIRTGVKIVGRDRIKNFVARQLATLIQGYVGVQAARALAPHVADAGLKLLSLEAAPEQLGAEALVDTLEEAVADVMSLPAEALEDPLRLQAEVGDALGAAAIRHLPPAVLRDDLPGHDADGPGWVSLPGTGKARRYRRSARRFDVSLTRARAGEIALPGAETLEDRLLDAGVGTWPVSAEVQVFETMPGGHLGHIAAGEGGDVMTAEFEELSPATAGQLLGRAALGTRAGVPGPAGKRYFRMVVPGKRVVRRRSRIALRLRAQLARPQLRVHVRVGERLAHRLVGLLERKDQAEVVATVGRLLGPRVQEAAAQRLTRMLLGRVTKATVAPARGQAIAAHLVEAIKTGLAKELPTQAATMTTAAKDPAAGLTLTFVFTFADQQALASGMPGAPVLTIRPGSHSD